jgi:hypothetical protein
MIAAQPSAVSLQCQSRDSGELTAAALMTASAFRLSCREMTDTPPMMAER